VKGRTPTYEFKFLPHQTEVRLVGARGGLRHTYGVAVLSPQASKEDIARNIDVLRSTLEPEKRKPMRIKGEQWQ